MSYISDYIHSDHTEEDEYEYEQNAIRDNARDRYEREHEFDYSHDMEGEY